MKAKKILSVITSAVMLFSSTIPYTTQRVFAEETGGSTGLFCLLSM